MVRLLNYLEDSAVDGSGLRTVFFFAGCPHHCNGCHNPSSWNRLAGEEVTLNYIQEVILGNPLNHVTFSGGDPFLQAKELIPLAKWVKESTQKSLWVYTGYTIEALKESQDKDYLELLKYTDVLVDGPFQLNLRDESLKYRGSSNQRILERPYEIITNM